VLIVGGDLMARSRLVDAASRSGMTLETTQVAGLLEQLREIQPVLLVVDLDEGGEAVLAALVAARENGSLPARVVGFYSHVNRGLGQAAEAAGCEAWPRGKFWGSLPGLLEPNV
jgi:hypothetical protein